MIEWKRPSGTTVKTNDRKETIDYCESLDWKRVKRKRRTKAEIEADKKKADKDG